MPRKTVDASPEEARGLLLWGLGECSKNGRGRGKLDGISGGDEGAEDCEAEAEGSVKRKAASSKIQSPKKHQCSKGMAKDPGGFGWGAPMDLGKKKRMWWAVFYRDAAPNGAAEWVREVPGGWMFG
jgi:hypothetical protein